MFLFYTPENTKEYKMGTLAKNGLINENWWKVNIQYMMNYLISSINIKIP